MRCGEREHDKQGGCEENVAHGAQDGSTAEADMNRRTFLKTTAAAMAAGAATHARSRQAPPGKPRFRTGLVAYSYRQALQAKTMTYEDLIRIAVETGTDGIDMTVYWLPNTSDDYLLGLRRLQEPRRDLQHRHARAPRAALA
jgi:TAT (twin-arginine translocation) pathway signal sequence